MSSNTAINVAKLQEQLAKNMTLYSTGYEKTSTSDSDSVRDAIFALM